MAACLTWRFHAQIVSSWSKCFRSDFLVEYWAYLLSQTPQMMDKILAEQVEWSLRDMCLISSAVPLIHFEKWIWRICAGWYLVAQIGWWKIREKLRRRRRVDTRLLKLYHAGKISFPSFDSAPSLKKKNGQRSGWFSGFKLNIWRVGGHHRPRTGDKNHFSPPNASCRVDV